MLQLPQSLAWLQDAPEPFVVVVDRWIVVVPAGTPPAGTNTIIAVMTAILIIERLLRIG